jgi:multimeric flavodoxin WrbA
LCQWRLEKWHALVACICAGFYQAIQVLPGLPDQVATKIAKAVERRIGMDIVVLSSSPNKDGLTAACAAAAVEGVEMAGGSAEEIRLNDLCIGACQACDHGWGTCLSDHSCQVLDDFQGVHERVRRADGYILVTPVYWGEMSESAKALTDRLRRCEATRQEDSALSGKPVIAVAAAGGSGGGMVTCLGSMERWIQHVRARVFDLLPVNRWSQAYKLGTIRAAAQALVTDWKGCGKQS